MGLAMLTLLLIGLAYPIVLVVFFGTVVWMDWFLFLSQLPAREGWLTKAAHGIGVIVCGGYVIERQWVPASYHTLAYSVYGVLVALGIFWLIIGSARAQIHGDAHLLIRAIVKFGVGCAVFAAWHLYQTQVPLPYRHWMDPCVQLVALWCWATGLTKFIICLRPLPRLAASGTPDAYGGARFRQGRGLQENNRRSRYRRG